MAKKQPLHCTFHNPNSAARTAAFLLRLFAEVDRKKLDDLRNTACAAADAPQESSAAQARG